MKRLLKSILALLIFVIFTGTPVHAEESTTAAPPSDEKQLTQILEQYIGYINKLSADDIEYAINNSNGRTQELYSSMKEIKSLAGGVESVMTNTLKIVDIDNGYKVTMSFMCENCEASIEMVLKKLTIASEVVLYDRKATCAIDSIVFVKTGSLESEEPSMSKALMNTIMGLFTVFAVLILIAFIIYLFKYITVIGDVLSGKEKSDKKEEVNNSITNTIAQIEAKETNAMNDLELVAVITAAIAAHTNTSSDSFVVKKIKRVK